LSVTRGKHPVLAGRQRQPAVGRWSKDLQLLNARPR
jgi:hypothetical protein